jgi:transcriptional regulator with XRE-family HTH domain
MEAHDALRASRKQTGLTAGQLSILIGARPRYISAIERGVARPSPEFAKAIVWVLAEHGANIDAEFAVELAFMPSSKALQEAAA